MTMLSSPMLHPGAGVNGFQVRLARQALRWRYADAAEKCGVSVGTIQRIEDDDETITIKILRKVKERYEAAGVEFLADGRGIKLKKVPE
jgi:transcriptional regulator with XRE-family HTH domain